MNLSLSTRHTTVTLMYATSITKRLCTVAATEANNKNVGQKIKPRADNGEPKGWDVALPFKSIPGPQPLPIIGNIWRYLPYIGDLHGLCLYGIYKKLHERYGKIAILKGIPMMKDVVVIFSPEDIETMHRNEGAFPSRNILNSIKYYRAELRADIFQGENGLLVTDDLSWYNFRTKANAILLQPKIVLQYAESVDLIANDFLRTIRELSQSNVDGEMPGDFKNHIYSWSLELIAFVALDRRIGCLDANLKEDSEPHMLVKSMFRFFDLLHKMDFLPSLWRIYPTKNWKEYVRLLDYITFTLMKHIQEAMTTQITNKEKSELSVLQRFLEFDRKVALSMAIDLLMGGVETTGQVTSAGLYYLAKSPLAQDKLRQELRALLPSKDSPVTKEVLANAPYLKAVIKELLRLAPIMVGHFRVTPKDMVLQGYQIPKGTSVCTGNLLLCQSDTFFPQASEFIPERWLRSAKGNSTCKNASPFVYLPFGFGPRYCIGQKIASLEMEIFLAKVIRNFRVEWHHGDMTFKAAPFYGTATPLKFRFKEVNN